MLECRVRQRSNGQIINNCVMMPTTSLIEAGPVGLIAAYAAILRGVSRVYTVDHITDRQETARAMGAIPMNFKDSDPVEQIMSREPDGVARTVDAVGYEQVNHNLTVQADVIIRNMLAVTSAGGGMGPAGVYTPRAANSSTASRVSAMQDPLDGRVGHGE